MKKEPGEANDKTSTTMRDRMHALYEEAPYPMSREADQPPGVPLIEHWINSFTENGHPALHSLSRILVAGCGSGLEAIMLAKHYPKATIVGLDFSPRSIEKARDHARLEGLENIVFAVADLTKPDWVGHYSTFDFVLCHGVADYVTDPATMLIHFSQCLAPRGIIYLTVNSPSHPAQRIREAMVSLGIDPLDFRDTPEQRQRLQMVAQLMGEHSGIQGLGNASTAYLNVDVFAPFFHHYSFDKWCDLADQAGLKFRGSMEGLEGLTMLGDVQLPMLFGFDRAGLAAWMIRLRNRPGFQMLFSREESQEVRFEDTQSFMSWKPAMAAAVGRLPVMNTPPDQPMHLTLRFEGLPDFIIYSTAYELEAMRRCNGGQSLQEIINSIPAEGNLEALKACFFRAYHYGILS